MPHDRERIQDDLRGLIEGDVLCDPLHIQMYASDASIYEILPLGVVRPRSTADVLTVVQYAAENLIPLHARGAGSGLAGESLGPGLVVDFAHYQRRILRTDAETVRVQAGVTVAQLNAHLARDGRMFGPDPATGAVSTLGGVIAMDGSGSHWLKHGATRRHVVSLQVALATGELVEVSTHPTRIAPADVKMDVSPKVTELVAQLATLLGPNLELIHRHQPQSLVNRSGYHLDGLLDGQQLHLAQLFVGSEGTLGLVTEATLRTVPIASHVGVVLLFFDRLDSAARAALEIPHLGASACDLLDRRLVSIARETDRRFDELLPADCEALLLVEAQGNERLEVRDRLQQIVHRIRKRSQLAFDSRLALEPADVQFFWTLSQKVVPRLYRLRGQTRPLPFVESMAIPPTSLPEFLVRMQNVLKTHEVTASLFAHAGHGQLHLRPFLDLSRREDVTKLQPLATDLYRELMEVKGTIGGEHGDGLSRTWFVREQYGPVYELFREVKQLLDPQLILNPGKVVATVPPAMTSNLRPLVHAGPPPLAGSKRDDASDTAGANDDPDAVLEDDFHDEIPEAPRLVQLQLSWKPDEMMHAARSCNGCGACRTRGDDMRMCPIFHIAPTEEASPRAKANLMRGVLSGRLDQAELSTEALKQVADLCVNCHQCRLECPAEVDIPKLMIEARAQFVATNGLKGSDFLMARLDSVLAWGNLLAPVSNWAMGNRVARWFLEKLLGIAQGRKLPRFAGRTFLQLAERRHLTRPPRGEGRRVLYFVDLHANWFDTQLAEAVVAVLEHNGLRVYVHPDQLRSGMELITAGAVELARDMAQQNVRILAEAVRAGYHVVTSEPTAALCLKHEYLHLLGTAEAQLVAENSSDACAYLWQLHQTGKLELDFKPVGASIGYHLPCHQRAVSQGSPAENLLRLIRGLNVRRIERGCSGMAGFYGLKPENYRSSLRAGWGLIDALRDPEVSVGSTECTSCKMQMEQGTTKPTIHPIKLLALAYGLMPEMAALLGARGEDLVLT